MKFIRRQDLDTQARMDIVVQAMHYQGQYGEMTRIANENEISRTFLYQLTQEAKTNLENLLKPDCSDISDQQKELDRLILLLRLEGKCSIEAISFILTMLGYFPHSVGYISRRLTAYGEVVPSTLLSNHPIFIIYMSDEIFANSRPILITIEHKSSAILKIELAENRSKETWGQHFIQIEQNGFYTIGLSSDGGTGVTGGYGEKFPDNPWYSDHFHEFSDLTKLLVHLEKQAYAAMGSLFAARDKFDNARSEQNLQKRMQQWEKALITYEQAIQLYETLSILSDMLFSSINFFDSLGHPCFSNQVKENLQIIFEWMDELNHPPLTQIVATLRSHLDQITLCFSQLENVYTQLRQLLPNQDTLDFLCLAWHHHHKSYQTKSDSLLYHQKEFRFWLNCAQVALGDQFESVKKILFEQLDSLVRASSLVEMVNSLIRPYLNSSKGQITQETLNLIMFYHNHHRYKSGKRKGLSPIEILTAQPLKHEWIDLFLQKQQILQKEGKSKKLRLVALNTLPVHEQMESSPMLQAHIQDSSAVGNRNTQKKAA